MTEILKTIMKKSDLNFFEVIPRILFLNSLIGSKKHTHLKLGIYRFMSNKK